MRNYEAIIAKTRQGKFELVAVEYETVGRVSKPTQQSERILATYDSWKNLSAALKYNLDLQSEFQKVCGQYF